MGPAEMTMIAQHRNIHTCTCTCNMYSTVYVQENRLYRIKLQYVQSERSVLNTFNCTCNVAYHNQDHKSKGQENDLQMKAKYLTLQQNEGNFQFLQEHYERGTLVCLVMLKIMTLASCGLKLTF